MILILFRILEASVINQEWRCIYQLWRRSWIIMGAAENVNMTPYHIIAKLLFSLLIRQVWILRCTKVTDTYIITGWPPQNRKTNLDNYRHEYRWYKWQVSGKLYKTKIHITHTVYQENYQSIPPYLMALIRP